MFFRLLLLFTIVPLVELALLVQIGDQVGLLATIALVVLTGAIGAWLARSQGLRALGRLQDELGQGRMPTEALLDGLMIFIAGAVLLTPGLLTDLFGFFLLVPAGRRTVRGIVSARLRRRFEPGGPKVIVIEPDEERRDG
ncbi:MAG: FxsA family protein [bacterium]|nr:FxsA family protein [bacterium]